MLDGCVDWPLEFKELYTSKGYWENRTIGDILDRSAGLFPERDALVAYSPVWGETRDTYASLLKKVNRLAIHLKQMGIKPLDRIIMHLPNIAEFIYLYFALHKIAAIPVLCLPVFRYTELADIHNQLNARGYAASVGVEGFGFDYLGLAQELNKIKPLDYILVAGTKAQPGMILINELLDDPVEEKYPENYLDQFRPDPNEIALFQLSGGTTGKPKLIPRTHNGFLSCSKFSGFLGAFSPYTSFLITTPIAHGFTMVSPGMNAAVEFGAKCVLSLSPAPDRALFLIERERVTYANAVPAVIISWMNSEALKKYDISSLEVIISGGSKFNPEVARLIPEKLGCKLQMVLGMTEGLNIFTRLDYSEKDLFETVGQPLLPVDEVRVVDDDGNDVPEGEVGELWTRGPYTVRGYYKADEHNTKAFTADGFFKTGDLVRQRDGKFIVEGRSKDLVNRGGEKINAEELENFILSHPSVFNTAVVSMPDQILGEKVCACVILREGTELTLDELREFLLAKQIAKFKLPERLEIYDSFFLTAVGKISKVAMRADIAEKCKREA